MNRNYLAVLDLETGGLNVNTCEVTELCCSILDPKSLEVVDTFHSDCKPRDFNNLEDTALKITHKTKASLEQAPPLDEVWKNFRLFIKQYGKGKFDKPIICGYNILSFDIPILNRLAKEYGDVDKDGKQNLFSDFMIFDLMHSIWLFTNDASLQKYSENGKDNIKFDTVMRWLGINTEGSHNAKIDVQNETAVIVRFLKLYRNIFNKVTFEGSMKNA